MKDIVVSVSGGRSSAMMARHIQTSEKYSGQNKIYVFSNTGQERPETIQFLKDIVRFWNIPLVCIEGVYSEKLGVGVKHKVVGFDGLDMDSRPFEEAIMHMNKGVFDGLPNHGSPYCSGRLKARPIHSYARSVLGTNDYIKAIGYRFEDVPRRITMSALDIKKDMICPLLTDFEKPVDLQKLDEFWEGQPFRLGIDSRRGNCKLCWKKSKNNLIETIREGVDCLDWYRKMEKIYNGTFFRERLTIDELVALASDGSYKPEQEEEEPCFCGI